MLFNYYWEEKGNECQKYLKVMSEYVDFCQVGLNIFPTLEMQNREVYYCKGNCIGQSKNLRLWHANRNQEWVCLPNGSQLFFIVHVPGIFQQVVMVPPRQSGASLRRSPTPGTAGTGRRAMRRSEMEPAVGGISGSTLLPHLVMFTS